MGWRNRMETARPGRVEARTPRRADWRLLLPDRPRSGLAVLGLGPPERWAWLVDDGWTTEVVTDLGPPAPPIDVVVFGPGALYDSPGVVERAVRAVGPGGAIVTLGGGHRRLVRSLRRAGLDPVRRYLAFPDAVAPSRLVPLDHAGGLAWLAGPRPARPEAALPITPRMARAVMRRVGRVVPEPFGEVVVVGVVPGEPEIGGPGTPSAVPLAARLIDTGERATDAIVLTSGFDEGSRSVVLPLAGTGRPPAVVKVVVKVVARPAYRPNAEGEQEQLGRLAGAIGRPGLVPSPLGTVEVDGTTAVVESYAGRWTASAVLNEQRTLARRAAVLEAVMDRLVDLARIGAVTETWNRDGFEELIGRWFDHLDRMEGTPPARRALRDDLRDRSEALEGRELTMGLRHFDLGPWNVVFADRSVGSNQRHRDLGPGDAGAGGTGITVVDWELADPRTGHSGPAGADHLYFTKYWLHIAMGSRTAADELAAFAFLASGDMADPRSVAGRAMATASRDLGLDPAFLPLLEAHLWSEAACYQAERARRGGGATGEGGGPARYLTAVAERRSALFSVWPLSPPAP